MTVIYDGIDLDAFRPSRDGAAVRRELGIPPGVPLVGIVGHIQAWKGQDVVLRALRLVRDTVPDVHCLVVGGVHRRGSEYARDLHRFVEEHGLTSHVIFTGPRDDVPDLMTAMDVVIHASVVAEPFGRVVLEGMAAARAVIATDMGGVPEILKDGVTGKLVPPDDPQSLAVAIVGLLADADQRRRLGENGRAEVEQRFSMQRHVRSVTDVYASLGGTTARREP
jgi:glycosyltransferase involved in cell wall biosynthesis